VSGTRFRPVGPPPSRRPVRQPEAGVAPAVSDEEIAALLRLARMIAAAESLLGDAGVMIRGERRS
jgi:hypothetical protein